MVSIIFFTISSQQIEEIVVSPYLFDNERIYYEAYMHETTPGDGEKLLI